MGSERTREGWCSRCRRRRNYFSFHTSSPLLHTSRVPRYTVSDGENDKGETDFGSKKGLLSALFVAKTRVGEFLPIPSILFALPFPPSFLASLTKKIFPEKGKREREKEGEATELEAGTIFERRLTFGLPLSPSFLTRQKVFSPPPHWTPVSWDQHMISEGGRRPDVVCGCDFGR